jgi:hypothetical protein
MSLRHAENADASAFLSGPFLHRLWNSAVLWSWAFNGLRLGSAILLLPLLMRLPPPDFGFYYLLVSIIAIGPLIDFGFAAAIERNVSYAMGGAKELVAHGLYTEEIGTGTPNADLLWRLLDTTRTLYRILTLVLIVALGIAGSVVAAQAAHQTSDSRLAWLAWGLALLNAAFDVYSGWWVVFLRGMNRVLASSRIWAAGYALKLALSCALLLAGAGLPSVFAAGLISSFLIRCLARKSCLKSLPGKPVHQHSEVLSTLRTLWPNSWRLGTVLLTRYLVALANSLICFRFFGLVTNGNYGLSLQAATLIQAMATVWVAVKWPRIGQLRAQRNFDEMRRLLWPRIWLQIVTFIVLAVMAAILGPVLLEWKGSGKQLLPMVWFALLLVNVFLENQFIIWATFLTTENRVPTLKSMVTTDALTLAMVLPLVRIPSIGVGAFALGPLISGCLFNYWFWAGEGARNLQTTWFRYMFSPWMRHLLRKPVLELRP